MISKKPELNIAVRTLVQYVHQGGDLTVEFMGAARSLDGIRGHQRVQRSRPPGYRPEVGITHRLETEHLILNITGRIDGVFSIDGETVIDEIKTTVLDPDGLAADRYPTHWAQAQCYAYMFMVENGLEAIRVQLTYYQVETARQKEFGRRFEREALAAFFADLVKRYLAWAHTTARWIATRDGSIHALDFPFGAYRPGQREMAVSVYRTIRNGRQSLVQAATGIGKTMAVVFPAIKALADGGCEKIFYLTARTTGRMAAQQALDHLRKNGLRFKSVTLTAKDKICFSPGCLCSPDECAVAKGHFDRVGGALNHAFSLDALTRESIETIARQHRVCPFELSLELSNWVDGIICDYNYAFDPRVYLRRFFLEGSGNYTLLVDEAHNLVDRSREMFSAEIRKQPFLDLRRTVKGELPGLYRCMGKINTQLLRIRHACASAGGATTDRVPPESLYPALKSFVREADRWLALNLKTAYRGELLDLYFSVTGFLRVAEQFNDAYAAVNQMEGRDLRVKLFCLDPSGLMRSALDRARSAIFFSATLTPTDYFKKLLGCGGDVHLMRIPSPFPPHHLGLFVKDNLSTLFRHRSETAPRVARTLAAMVRHRPGNYLFYFPSYAYLEMVHSHFDAADSEMEIITQTTGMSEAEREAFIAGFTANPETTRVGFAVMGGIFGEGIDLAGSRLTGAAIVGVGLPGISPERELIRAYFAAQNNAGFEFAYLYPGINRVLQAAGRVIRTDQDRGTVLLVDTRYTHRRYAALLPAEWRPLRIRDTGTLHAALVDFWDGRD